MVYARQGSKECYENVAIHRIVSAGISVVYTHLVSLCYVHIH